MCLLQSDRFWLHIGTKLLLVYWKPPVFVFICFTKKYMSAFGHLSFSLSSNCLKNESPCWESHCSNCVSYCPSTDSILDMMNAQQEELSKIVHVPQAGFDNNILYFSDANKVLLYPTFSSGTVAGLSLLVLMLPGFGEPVSFPINHCKTDVAVI